MALEIFEAVEIDHDVHFSGKVDGHIHRFVITAEALDDKAHHSEDNSRVGHDRLHVFKNHKDEIAAIAEKLIDKDLAYDPVYTIDTGLFSR